MSDNVFNKLTKKDSMNHWRTMKYRKIYTGILYVFSALVLSLFPQFASIVKATSVHDDSFVTTTDVDLKNQYCGPGGSNDVALDLDDVVTAVLNNGTHRASFATAIESGRIGISNFTQHSGPAPFKNSLHVFWTTDTSLYLEWYAPYKAVYAHGSGSAVTSVFIDAVNASGTCVLRVDSSGLSNLAVVSTALTDGAVKSVVLETDYPEYPLGYEGPAVTLNGSFDDDEDGLDYFAEVMQGTLDSEPDTDRDGLSDLTESVWFEDRTDVFCDTVPDPDVCAYPDPLVKDLYVEIDWMDDGTTAYRPNSTQIGLLESAFNNKGINLHVDAGEFGGGNELPVYISTLTFPPDINVTDFFNLKNGDETYDPNFSEDRRGIWRYMITGNQMDDGEDDDTSGVSYGGDDDSFIALGRVSSDHPLAVNLAVAGTMIHELGHNLCLTDENNAYSGQDEDCVFEGIDSNSGNSYPSSMNYDKQFLMVDYSEGLNLVDDHDDWSAILLGMDDFIVWEDPNEGAFRGGGFGKQPIYNRS